MPDASTRNTYDPTVVSSPSSVWIWLARPIALALSSIGLVIFIAGVTSFSIHKVDSRSRMLLTPAGSVILSLGVLLGIGVIMKQREEKKMALEAQRSENDVLDLTAEFATIEMSVQGSDCSTEFPGDEDDGQNPQESTFTRFPPRPPCQGDVDPVRFIAPLPTVTPVMDNNEVLVVLEDPSLFEIPPSYEEACALSTEVDV